MPIRYTFKIHFTLFSHLDLRFQKSLPSRFPGKKKLDVFLPSSMGAICPDPPRPSHMPWSDHPNNFSSIVQQPLVGQGRLIFEASRSHSSIPHLVGLGRVTSQTHRPLLDNTQHSLNIHAPAGFEPAISASERQQTHALDRAANGIGHPNKIWGKKGDCEARYSFIQPPITLLYDQTPSQRSTLTKPPSMLFPQARNRVSRTQKPLCKIQIFTVSDGLKRTNRWLFSTHFPLWGTEDCYRVNSMQWCTFCKVIHATAGWRRVA